MKVVIYGGRDYPRAAPWMLPHTAFEHRKEEVGRMFRYLDQLHAKIKFTEIVSGGAAGADRLGEAWAKSRGFIPKVFKPDYAKYVSTVAPKKRNIQMGDYADMGIGFPGGNGTRHMTETLLTRKKPVYLAYEAVPVVTE